MYIPSLHLYGTNISQPNKNDPRAADVQTKKKGDDRRATIRTVSERGKGIRCHAYVSASGLVFAEQDERYSTVTAVMLKDAESTLLCV